MHEPPLPHFERHLLAAADLLRGIMEPPRFKAPNCGMRFKERSFGALDEQVAHGLPEETTLEI